MSLFYHKYKPNANLNERYVSVDTWEHAHKGDMSRLSKDVLKVKRF